MTGVTNLIFIVALFAATLSPIYLLYLALDFLVRLCFGPRPVLSEGVGRSVAAAVAVTAWDAGFSGAAMLSLPACPVWFVVSVVKNAIQRPGWRPGLARAAIPVLTLGLLLANDAFQRRVAETNARRIIAACEKYHADNGGYPKKLDALAPRYLPSIPLAKYCLGLNKFLYFNFDGSTNPTLFWYVLPPFGRKIWNFGDRRWSYLD